MLPRGAAPAAARHMARLLLVPALST